MIETNCYKQASQFWQKYTDIYVLDISEFILNNITSSYCLLRPMTRREFNLYSNIAEVSPDQFFNSVINLCVLYPNLDDSYKCGIDSFIVNAIKYISGFSSENVLSDGIIEYRQQAQTLEATIVMFICKAFPAYKVSEVEDMTFREQMKLVCMAEKMLNTQIDYGEFFGAKKATKPILPIQHEYSFAANSEDSVMPSIRHSDVTSNNFEQEVMKMQQFLNG